MEIFGRKILILLSFVFLSLSIRSQYCTIYHFSAGAFGSRISDVSTTGGSTNISSLSNGIGTDGYSHNTSSFVTVTDNGSFNISVTAQAQCGIIVYVDWNEDNDFLDANEQVLTGPSFFSTPPITATGSISVPSGTSTGTKRMRIRAADFAYPPNACDTTAFGGETEDYDIVVAPSCSVPVDISSLSASANADISLSWTNGSCFDEVMIVASTSAITAVPSGDGSSYTANASYGSGTEISTGEYVVYKGTSSSTTISSLTFGSTYHFKVFTRKGSSWSTGVTTSSALTAPLVITEIMDNPNNVSDANGEYFEIYNPHSSAIDIQNYVIKDLGSETHTISSSVVVPAEGFVVLGRNSNTAQNGGINVDYAYGSDISFDDFPSSGDEIILEDGSGNEVDRVEFDNGSSWSRTIGSAMIFSKEADDDNNLAANWSTATWPEGGLTSDQGSPGSAGLGQRVDIAYKFSSGAWDNTPDNSSTNGSALVTGFWTLSSDVTVDNLLIETSNAFLVVPSGYTLTVNGRIENGNWLEIQDGGALLQTHDGDDLNLYSGTMSRVTKSSGTVVDDTRFQYWSSPVQSTSIAQVFVWFNGINSSDIYSWNENGSPDQWSSVSQFSSMTPGRGYAMTSQVGISNSAVSRRFESQPNNGDVSLSVSAAANDFILVGNPYPSELGLSSFMTDNTDLSGTAYFWNHITPASGGLNSNTDYASWNSSGGTAASSGGNAPNGNVAIAQGFFVQVKTSPSVNPITSVSFNNGQRVSSNNAGFFKRGTQEKRQRIWLNLTNNAQDFNQLLVAFTPDATKGKDRLYDGKKFKAHPRVAFYSMFGNEELAIQGLPYVRINETERIPLGIDAWIPGTYSISLDSLDNYPSNYQTWLEDEEQDTLVPLSALPYSFQVDSIGTIQNRFALVIKNEVNQNGGGQGIETPEAPGPSTGIEEAEEDWIKIYAVHQELRIEASQSIKQYTMYDVSGRMIETRTINSTNTTQRINHNGLYLIEVELENGEKQTQKVVF